MLTWHTAAEWSQIAVRRHMATNMFRPSECFAAALVRTDPPLLTAVPQQVSAQLAGCGERPVASELRAREGALIGVHALVLPQPTGLIKTSTAAIEMTLQRLAADEVLATMRRHVTLVCKRHSATRM